MKKIDEHLLQQEVQELTDLLRNDVGFERLRNALTQKGFSIKEILLAAFMEDEVGMEYGAFVTSTGEVYEYQRDTGKNVSLEFIMLRQVKDIEEAIQNYRALETALQIVAKVP